MTHLKHKWRIALDRGGTFTDIWAVSSEGVIFTDKILGSSGDSVETIVSAVKRIMQVGHSEPLPVNWIESIRIGTTLVTNALLERKGSDTALFISEGFRDLLEIGDQTRPELFDLNIRKAKILYSKVSEINERINSIGKVEKPLDENQVKESLSELHSLGFRSLAIVFLHSWKNNTHELMVKHLALEAGINNIVTSSELLPIIRIVPRGQTTLLEAYLSPVLAGFIDNLRKIFKNVKIEIMQSSGGLIGFDEIRAGNTLLSGPAGGVAGCIELFKKKSLPVIGFDMGGTSTDVSRYDGHIARKSEAVITGIKHRTDMLDIETVAAGGGSVCTFKDGRYQVGPESAGADPGPACYGLGGPATITDANLILGRIVVEQMNPTFGKNRNQTLDKMASENVFQKLANTISSHLGKPFSMEQTALGFITIADEAMARAIRKVSLKRGYDVRNHTLVAFGGAGPQHACRIADKLGIREILISSWSGVFSAFGISSAPTFKHTSQSILKPLSQKYLDELLTQIGKIKRVEQLRADLDVQVIGSDSCISIPLDISRDTAFSLREKLSNEYQIRYGLIPDITQLEMVTLNLFEEHADHSLTASQNALYQPSAFIDNDELQFTQLWLSDKFQKIPLIPFEKVNKKQLQGPALIYHSHFSVIVLPEFSYSLEMDGNLYLRKTDSKIFIQSSANYNSDLDPVLLEIFNHRFMGIAEQMGFTLENTAHSVNIKERRDFSCALFDPDGKLVANAPHIPVHLGSMGETVRAVMAARGNSFKHGDVFITNHPHKGGSHLPDITLVTPVMISGEQPDFFVVNRGHHADIGGISPGSMPPNGTSLDEEGIILENILYMRNGKFLETEIRKHLTTGPFPARNLQERMSDLKAQAAANLKGIREIEKLLADFSLDTIKCYMRFIRENAATAVLQTLMGLLEGNSEKSWSFHDNLDDGTLISVKLTAIKDSAEPLLCKLIVDFTGTGPQSKGNLNAPFAVTRAAVMYVLRCLLKRDIPLNSGFFDPVELIIPAGCILNPSNDAAVVGGNVETSQRVVDVLLGAFGLAAASQGTMNNFLFGDLAGHDVPYYETIGGGSGAGFGFNGASGVQVHMTNTRITDPEILEYRYPELRLDKFSIIKGSGGVGKFKGGDGLERQIRFLEKKQVSILSERRINLPFGIKGGKPGKAGKNVLIKPDNTQINLGGKAELIVQPGESILIRTPSGGGYGSKS